MYMSHVLNETKYVMPCVGKLTEGKSCVSKHVGISHRSVDTENILKIECKNFLIMM
jgi:hypothetical protein